MSTLCLSACVDKNTNSKRYTHTLPIGVCG